MNFFNLVDSTVYHYCSLETFYRIISSRRLRLTNIKHFRDTKEQVLIFDFLSSYIKGKKGREYAILRKFIKEIKTGFELPPTFAFCCSMNPKSLSQWRAYAADGKGVAIGINPYFIRGAIQKNEYSSILLSLGLGPYKVLYSDSDADELAEKIVEITREIIKNTGIETELALKDTFTKKEFIRVLPSMISIIFVIYWSALFKHSDFQMEDEARIIYTPRFSENYKDEIITRLVNGPIKYDFMRNEIISYHEINIEESTESTKEAPFINELWLGPTCKANEEDIKVFLESYNMLGPMSKIKRFDTPYF